MARIDANAKRYLESKFRQFGDTPLSVDELQTIYGDEIKQFIQKSVEQSYANGVQYVQDATRVQIPLTVEDVTNIELMTNKLNTDFWRSVSGIKERKRIQDIEKQRKKKDTEFDPHPLTLLTVNRLSAGLANRYAANITTSSLASGLMTSAKRSSMLSGRLPPPRRLPAFGQPAEGELTITGTVGLEISPTYIYKTEEDNRVCPECEPLNDVEMSEELGNMQIPPIHDACRCRLMLKLD